MNFYNIAGITRIFILSSYMKLNASLEVMIAIHTSENLKILSVSEAKVLKYFIQGWMKF